VSQSLFACDLFCTLSRELDYISNANPTCSCDKLCKFQFRPIHPPRRLSPRTVREVAKNTFYRTRHLRVFLVFKRPDGPRLVSDGARFSIGWSMVLTCVFAMFLSEAHPGVADGPPQGPRRSAHMCFSKKLLLS
jgi:hypothetical protein